MIEVVNCYFIEGREAAEVNRILLLEDDEALGRGICMALETPDCTVTHCATCLQTTDILQNMVFDLLILDINLLDGSGLELCLRPMIWNWMKSPAWKPERTTTSQSPFLWLYSGQE